ncbi:hypothetical protein ACHWQZ_G014609 [Mnemiopsis leidyi]
MSDKKFLVIYGSQTGQSEAIAERIALDSESLGLEAELVCGEELVGEMDRLDNQVAVFVVSSTGEGDPPENFESFWSALHDTTPQNLKYTLLGLGDSNYTEFGGFPNSLKQLLDEAGAKSFYEYQLADDQVGLELVVEPWIEGLWDPLKQALSGTSSFLSLQLDQSLLDKLSNLDIDRDLPKSKQMFQYEFCKEDFTLSFPEGVNKFILPFAAGSLEKSIILKKTCLTERSEKTKETYEMEFATSDVYGPGDSFGMLCENRECEVWDLLKRLKLEDKAHKKYSLTPDPSIKPHLLPKHILRQCSPYYALKYTLDIRSLPKKALLVLLAEHCVDKREGDCLRYLSSKEGSKDLNEVIYSRSLTLLELLSLFPSCLPPFCSLLQHLPRLTPRYYSVSRLSEHGVKFVFNHVTNIRGTVGELPAVPGVCSSWLRELKEGDCVYVYRRKNTGLKPVLGDGGMVMVGAGTGVAPYLAFLDYVAQSNAESKTMLITGNRYEKLDSIYREEFLKFQSDGVLQSYLTAYSRDADSTCCYVQDCIKQHAQLVMEYLDEGARVYVCGDAKGLSVGVHEMFCSVLSESKCVSVEEAKEIISCMRKEGRYCEDIWS